MNTGVQSPVIKGLTIGSLLLLFCVRLSMDKALTTLELGVSIPAGTSLSPAGIPQAVDIWTDMINGSAETIDMGQFYLVSHPGSKLEGIVSALIGAAARGVRIRILCEKKMAGTYPELLERFKATEGISVRHFDWQGLTGGIQHAKYFIIDGKECWIGSHNFDWRALEHIHETGIRIADDTASRALSAVFSADWDFCGGDRTAYARLRAHSPFVFKPDLYLAASPIGYLPPGVQPGLDALCGIIDRARQSLSVQLLSYSTDQGHFPDLDQALRRAAARGVRVRLLVSDWSLTADGQQDLKDLDQVPGLQVRVVSIPQHSSGFIPYARVHHSKVLRADDECCVISTSNWSADYFTRSRNLELVCESIILARHLDRLFLSLWHSPYAFSLQPQKRYAPPPREQTAPQAPRYLTTAEFWKRLENRGLSFKEHPSKRVWNGRRAPLILDTPFKRRFKTVLTQAAAGEPDFDGSLIIASWGCGSNCQHFAIIEPESGMVHDGLTSRWGIRYRKESSLIVVNDPEGFRINAVEEDPFLPLDFTTEFHRWDGQRLVHLRTIGRMVQTEPSEGGH